MNEEMCSLALKNALIEIRNVCPDINKSFVLMNDGTIISGDEQPVDPSVTRAVNSIQELAEKTTSVGGLEGLLIDAENGKVYVSRINDMYFITALPERIDLSLLRTVSKVILPTILKVLESIPSEFSPAPLKSAPRFSSTPLEQASPPLFAQEETVEEAVEEVETTEPQETSVALEAETQSEVEEESSSKAVDLPSQQLIVDKFGGLIVRSDTVQIDSNMLQRWSSLLNVKEIREVDVETFGGVTARCKVKGISDQKLEGRGLIRVPEKTCELLEVKRGELVKVKPVLPESE